jgi:hypothetical protein
MPAIYLPVGSLIYLNTTIKLSDHNRQPVSIQTNRIEKQQRMANGTLRKFFIADKKTINVNWNMLPSLSTFTADGGYGAIDLRSFYEGTAAKASGALSGLSNFDVSLVYGGTSTQTFNMIFTSCSFELVKRNVKQVSGDTAQEFWNVSISLEEV